MTAVKETEAASLRRPLLFSLSHAILAESFLVSANILCAALRLFRPVPVIGQWPWFDRHWPIPGGAMAYPG